MSDDFATQKPKRDTASAFALLPSRDFDGGLLERHTYILTRADALAYLRLKRELSGRAKLALGLWFMTGGAAFGLLPTAVTGPEDSWQSVAAFLAVIALQFGLLLLGRALWRQWQARRMVPVPRLAEFEQWIDCVAGTEIDSEECAYLSPELIGQVLDTPTHIFVLNANSRIVIPKRAFASAVEADAMADQLRKLGAGPYYFETGP